jgi:hypothetical protein
MVKKMTKTAAKTPSFDEYKSIKDEIISISELRYENLLNRKFDEFRKSFKKEIMDELDPKFEAINSSISIIKWSIWSMPIFMTVILAVFTLLIKK